jgi:hypothetical protein
LWVCRIVSRAFGKAGRYMRDHGSDDCPPGLSLDQPEYHLVGVQTFDPGHLDSQSSKAETPRQTYIVVLSYTITLMVLAHSLEDVYDTQVPGRSRTNHRNGNLACNPLVP